jgi:hypothetical protein
MEIRTVILVAAMLLQSCTQISHEVGSGPNLVSGRAALVTNGYSRPCEEVALVQATPSINKSLAMSETSDGQFFREVAIRSLLANNDYLRLGRGVDCAADGSFSFHGVGSGKYYVIARITWAMRWAHHGGYIVRLIDVSGEMPNIDMTYLKNNA